jgi:hypothetical protein
MGCLIPPLAEMLIGKWFLFSMHKINKKKKKLDITEYPKFFFMIIPSWLRIWGITIK